MKKIIIVSENKDQSTSKIIRWIHYHKSEVMRINIYDPHFQIYSLTNSKAKIQTTIGLQEVNKGDVVWFRRFSSGSSFFMKGNSTRYSDKLKMFEFHEKSHAFIGFINFIRLKCNVICDPRSISVNKIDVLLEANKIGINCPSWIITNTKKQLELFQQKHKSIITKTFNAFSYTNGTDFYKMLASIVNKEDIALMPERFNSMFFQKYIKKKYELRIFFFRKTFFSMAIFSQKDDATKVDFRNYNRECPNRNIPVEIPQKYQKKLQQLADILHLDSGSFDVLVSNDDEYHFLEVNPIGQFGMVSFPCNYYIEKFIAESLIQEVKQH